MMRSATVGAEITTIDQYLAGLPADKREALEKLRRNIHTAAPGAEECISYRLPAFRLGGRMLVWFGAGTNHCAFYPGAVVQACQDVLEGYETSKGTVRFQPAHPLSASLVRKLVKARIAEIAADGQRAAGRRKARSREKSV
jgi:uncharacterized protein YdhG (YjbR/CyaY superfamily)